MNLATDILIPALVFFVMGIVGTELTTNDLRRVLVYPRVIAAGTIGQIVLLPALAVIFVRLTEPPELIAVGLLLLVTCPGGAISNSYIYLARANLALSISLTAFSSLLSVVTLPVAMALAFRFGLGARLEVEVPVGTIMAQLLLLLVTPAALGMLLRLRKAAFVERSRRAFQASTWVALVVIAGYVLWEERARVVATLEATILYAVGFTLAAMALGLLVSRLSGCSDPSDHLVLALEFAVRNLPIAILVGATALGRTDFVVFAGAVLIAQTPILVGTVVWFQKKKTTK